MGVLLGVLLFALAAYSARSIFGAASESVKLDQDETAIAEVLVKTNDMQHRPMRIGYPHNNEGRLVVTNFRMLYLSFDQTRTTVNVPLNAIFGVEPGTRSPS